MKLNVTSLLSFSVIAFSTLFFATSCSKSNNSNPSAGVSASVNGTNFSATGAYAGGVYDKGSGSLEIAGFKLAGTDSSAFFITFDDTVTLNKALDLTAFYSNADAEVIWTDKSTEFGSDASGSHGTMTVTGFDKTNKKISGTFSGVFYNYYSTDSVKVTNGTFNTAYVTP
ncbi:MAG TPA: hypothetical protein VGN00_15215 [Puia sp.]|jgi:hypothetical protein